MLELIFLCDVEGKLSNEVSKSRNFRWMKGNWELIVLSEKINITQFNSFLEYNLCWNSIQDLTILLEKVFKTDFKNNWCFFVQQNERKTFPQKFKKKLQVELPTGFV